MLAPVNRRAGVIAVLAGIGLAAAAFFIGKGTADQGQTNASTGTNTRPSKPAPGFAVLPTRRCHTESVGAPSASLSATTRAALPAALAKGMAAYRDSAGTTVIAPAGWECEAEIGADGGENVTAFPPGKPIDPMKPEAGQAVAVQVAAACVGCAGAMACTVLPGSTLVHEDAPYIRCPSKALREQVTHVSDSAALFYDPPGVKGSGVGSGGEDASFGGVATAQASAHKASCTLPAEFAEACAGIIAAALLAAPLY
jgi:hypothetical protein